MTIAILLTMLGANAGSVIAAQTAIDQTQPSATQQTTQSPQVPQQRDAIDVYGWVTLVLAGVAVIVIWKRQWWRLDRVPQRPDVLNLPAAAALLIAMLLLASIGAAVARKFIAGELAADAGAADQIRWQAQVILFAFLGQFIVACVLAWMIGATPRRSVERRQGVARAVMVGMASMIVAWPIVATAGLIGGTLARWLSDQPQQMIVHDTLKLLADPQVAAESGGWFWLMCGLVTIGAAIFEEIMYRGIVQDALAHTLRRRWIAIVSTSAMFALMHGSIVRPEAMVPLFVLSLALGWAYEKTGRLMAPMTMHFLFNAANLLMAWSTVPA